MGINVPGSGGGRQLRPPPPAPVRRGSPPTTGAGVIADRPMHGFSGAPQRQQVRQSVIDTRRANASVVQRATSNAGHAVSQSVRQTVGHVFDHQNPAQQAAILRGALRSSSPYAQAVLDHVTTNLRSSFVGGSAYSLKAPKGQGSVFGIPVSHLTTPQSHQFAFGTGSRGGLDKALGDVGRFAQGLLTPHQTDLQQLANKTGAAATPQKALEKIGQAGSKAIQAIPIAHTGAPGEQLATRAGMGPGQFGKNFAKGVVNVPAETVASVGIPLVHAAQGKFAQAGREFAGGYTQFAKHPWQTVTQYPFETLLMARGALDLPLRGAQGVVRAAGGKGPIDLTRPSIELTGNLTKERPGYSKNPIDRNAQKTVEGQRYRRTPQGTLVYRSQHSQNNAIRGGVSDIVGQNERVRKALTAAATAEHMQRVLASRPQRTAKAVKGALKPQQAPATIPGASVLALVGEGSLRRPETFLADLKVLHAEATAARERLANWPQALKENAKTLKDIEAAQKMSPAEIKHLFAVSNEHAPFQHALEQAAFKHGHYRDMTADALQRRVLTPVVHRYMQGARMDPALGMVKTASVREAAVHLRKWNDVAARASNELQRAAQNNDSIGVFTARQALTRAQAAIQSLTERPSVPIPTEEMRAFVNRQTGSRPIYYTSHQAPRGDSAFFTKGQGAYPRQAVMGNTMFAVTHGLRDVSHEALLEHVAHLTNVVEAHNALDHLFSTLALRKPDGSWWGNHKEAEFFRKNGLEQRGLNPDNYKVVNVGKLPTKLDEAGHAPHEFHDPRTIEQEAGFDLGQRELDLGTNGKFGLIHKAAWDQLKEHEKLISPNALLRLGRQYVTHWRKVMLGSSFKHLPGVLQEQGIRAAIAGDLPHHYFAMKNVMARAAEMDPALVERRTIQLTGGMQAGQVLAHQVRPSHAYVGTRFEPAMNAVNHLMRAPAIKTLRGAWNAWTRAVIGGTKHVVENRLLTANMGKQLMADPKVRALMRESHSLMRLQGAALDEAARGFLSDKTARRLYAGNVRVFGKWTDLRPMTQQALMVSPFGMWYVNSARWLARLPVDHPKAVGGVASAEIGTAKIRQALGLDMFAPNHLPLYKQGAVPVGGNQLLAQQYYTAFPVVSDPLETAASLVFPWWGQLAANAFGLNGLYQQVNKGKTSTGQRGVMVLNSILGNLVPFWQKGQTILRGGGKTDFPTLVPHGNVAKGAGKAFNPFRIYKMQSGASASGGGAKGDPYAAPSSKSGADPYAPVGATGSKDPYG